MSTLNEIEELIARYDESPDADERAVVLPVIFSAVAELIEDLRTSQTVAIEVYPENDGDIKSNERGWRWRLVSINGSTVAASGQNFASKFNAKRAATSRFPGVEVEETD